MNQSKNTVPSYDITTRSLKLGMHRISGWPDIRPDNPAFFDIRYPAGNQIALPDIRPAGYPAKTVSGASLV
jgi:hypothetical protein